MPQRPSYRDTLRGMQGNDSLDVEGSDGEDGDVLDDGVAEEVEDSSLFSMRMFRHEKMEARKPWRTSLIIKLVKRKIGHQYILKRLQATWRLQSTISIIDLHNDFFIIRLKSKEDYNTAFHNGSWLVGGHYLHV